MIERDATDIIERAFRAVAITPPITLIDALVSIGRRDDIPVTDAELTILRYGFTNPPVGWMSPTWLFTAQESLEALTALFRDGYISAEGIGEAERLHRAKQGQMFAFTLLELAQAIQLDSMRAYTATVADGHTGADDCPACAREDAAKQN